MFSFLSLSFTGILKNRVVMLAEKGQSCLQCRAWYARELADRDAERAPQVAAPASVLSLRKRSRSPEPTAICCACESLRPDPRVPHAPGCAKGPR